MKNAIISTMLLFLLFQASVAQNNANKFSIGINLFRYAPASGGYYYLTNGLSEMSCINGLDFTFQQNARIGYFVSLRNVNSHIDEPGIDWFNKYNTKGIEVYLGPTISTRELNRFKFLFSIGVFGEFTNVNGYVDKGDFTGIYEVNHSKNYYGVAPGLEVNFRVSGRISIFAKTRFRAGKVYYQSINSSSPFPTPLLEDITYNCYPYDPLSGFGVRVFF